MYVCVQSQTVPYKRFQNTSFCMMNVEINYFRKIIIIKKSITITLGFGGRIKKNLHKNLKEHHKFFSLLEGYSKNSFRIWILSLLF